MKPIVNEAQSKYSDKITFELYDITNGKNDAIATKYKVYLTPTFVIIDSDQKEIDRLIGEVPKATLEKFITGNIEKHGKSN
ncbi:MAG: thioredoxin family protein [Actinomycetota bacterium]